MFPLKNLAREELTNDVGYVHLFCNKTYPRLRKEYAMA